MQSSSQNTKQPPVPLLLVVLMVILVASTVAVAVFGWDYYRSTTELRMLSPEHKLFKASGTVGIACGIVATVLFITNLFYLPRRRFVNALRFFGSLRSWLSWHVISGFTGGAIVFLHAAFQVKSPVGTALVWSLGIVLCTGVVGRYLLRFIPRNQAGELQPMAEMEDTVMALIDELRPMVNDDPEAVQVLGRMADTVDGSRGASQQQGLGGALRRTRQVKADLAILKRTVRETASTEQNRRLEPLLKRVRSVYRQAATYQFASVFMDSWRTFHRVLALFFLVALTFHIAAAIVYGFVSV